TQFIMIGITMFFNEVLIVSFFAENLIQFVKQRLAYTDSYAIGIESFLNIVLSLLIISNIIVLCCLIVSKKLGYGQVLL
ncbi:MAG TPA: hypothetical protein VNS32_20690, partial [Flavisolibacter sp.]|nr:hypothetical protein [Flavisolibacter sp.]